MNRDTPISAVENKAYVKSVTVFGAVSALFRKPVFWLSNTTNIINVD